MSEKVLGEEINVASAPASRQRPARRKPPAGPAVLMIGKEPEPASASPENLTQSAAEPRLQRSRSRAKKVVEIVEQVSLEQIMLPGYRFRFKEWPAEAVERLAEAMLRHGFLGVLTGRRRGDNIEVAGGELRIAAARLAGLKAVPVRLTDLDDAAFFEVALQENFLRAGLTPLEEARAIRRLQEQGYAIELVAARLGRPLSITNARLALLRYPEIEEALRLDNLDASLAGELAAIEDAPMRNKLLRQALTGKLRQTDIQAAVHKTSQVPAALPDILVEKPTRAARKAARQIRSLPPADQHRSLATLVANFEANLDFYDLAVLASDNDWRKKSRKLLKSLKQEINQRLDLLD